MIINYWMKVRWNGMNMAVRRDAAVHIREDLRMLHDSWYTLQAAARGRVWCINAPLARYRQHAVNVSGADGRLTKKKMSHSRQKVLKSFEGIRERIRIIEELEKAHQMLSEENRKKLEAYSAYEDKREQAILHHNGFAYLKNEREYREYRFCPSRNLMIRDLLVTVSR